MGRLKEVDKETIKSLRFGEWSFKCPCCGERIKLDAKNTGD